MQEYKITEEDAGKRADVWLAEKYQNFARSALSKNMDDMVLINGKTVKAGYKLRLNDHIKVTVDLLNQQAPAKDLPVLFENDDVIVINKPAGLLTHSKGSINHEFTVANFILSKIHGFEMPNNRAGIVHRLDRGTSGVIICAKNPEVLKFLQKQFSFRKVKKNYVAIVSGMPEPGEAIIDVPIERNPAKPRQFRAGQHGKPAQTHYQAKRINRLWSLVKLQPATGRTHQLRVHLSYIKHPILGDIVYGGPPASRLMLHAKSLEITLPGGTRKIFSAPLPQEFDDYIKGRAADE